MHRSNQERPKGILQGSLDMNGDPRDSASLNGIGHFELVSAQLKPVEFLVKLGELLQIDELQLLKLSDATHQRDYPRRARLHR